MLLLLTLAVKLTFADWTNPCSNSATALLPFCNVSLSFEQRAIDLVYHQIPKLGDYLFEYQGLTGSDALGISELNIPPYQWWSEALHGVALSPGVDFYRDDAKIHSATMFPQVISTSSSFNTTLFYQIGEAISTEARAMNNNNQAGLTFWAPNINIFRDPRWGRGQETPGEDPFLTSMYAVNFVKGMQGNDDRYLKVSSCCKHFADYSMEDSNGYNRHNFNAIVNEYDQNDTYLVAFKYCIIGGNVSSIMCSYNAENGIPSCANKQLLTKYLRNEFGFNGYIVSDCGAVSNVQKTHHYTNTTNDTIATVFDAGMDINCGVYTQEHTINAIKANSNLLPILQQRIYESVLVQMRLGLYDDVSMNPWHDLNATDVCSNQSLKLSHSAAQQSIVMVKNNGNLPIEDPQTLKNIALIGPNARSKDVMIGNYHGIPPFVYSVEDGLKEYIIDDTKIHYTKGVDIDSNDTSDITNAIALAKNADITILVMGIDQSQESEGHDRISIALPGEQHNLIQQVSAAAKGSVILVILSGGCVDISMERDNDSIDAIFLGGYPGMYGGLAIMDVIFGSFNPSGRLTQTWYYQNYTSLISMDNMNMRVNKSDNTLVGRGYRYYDGDVVFPFGFGMSYTRFNCSQLSVNGDIVKVEIMNIGEMSGGAVVLVYWVPNNAGQNGVELKRLIAFGRVNMLMPNDETLLEMKMYQEFYNSHANKNGQLVLEGAC